MEAARLSVHMPFSLQKSKGQKLLLRPPPETRRLFARWAQTRCAYILVRRKYSIDSHIYSVHRLYEGALGGSVIFDAAGLIDPSLFTHSAKILAPGGVFISTGPLPHGWKDTWKLIRTIGAITIPSRLGNVNRRWV